MLGLIFIKLPLNLFALFFSVPVFSYCTFHPIFFSLVCGAAQSLYDEYSPMFLLFLRRGGVLLAAGSRAGAVKSVPVT